MKRQSIILAAFLVLAASFSARAQLSADLMAGYRAGTVPAGWAASLVSYAPDNFGDTYARADFSFNTPQFSLGSAYLEVARSFVFWKDTPLKGLGLHAEFNGFMNMDNSNWLFGLDYTLPVNCLLKVSVLYKTFNGNASSTVPVQLSLMWDVKDVLGLKGLVFRGQLKGWGENVKYWYGEAEPLKPDPAFFIIKTTPQIWYSVGQFFGWDGLSLGGELELSYNYLGCSGLRARPFAGLRLSF